MPAYFESGFSVREPMWHGLGNVLDEYPETWDDARKLAGLEWEPTTAPIYVERTFLPGEEIPATAPVVRTDDEIGYSVALVPAPDFKAIVRDDTRDVLHVASDSYQVVTHGQMGELLEAVLGADGSVKFETAGVIKGGRQVWALARIDEPFVIPGDDSPTYPWLAFLNSHDGTAACKVLPTTIRVVCWNTFNAASMEGDRTGHQVTIRHAGNVADRIEEAKLVLKGVRDDAAAWETLATELHTINVSDGLVSMFFERFIPTPENATERVVSDRAQRRALARAIYDESPTTETIRGTAYGLVQAAGEFLDHVRPYRTTDTYLARTLFRPEPVKTNVLRLVRELVAAGE